MKYIICLFFIVLTILLTLIFTKDLPSTFYNFNIVQLFTPIIQVIMLIGIAIYVNIGLSNTNKRNELMIELVQEYSKALLKLHLITIKYVDNKDETMESKILSSLTSLSQILANIEEIKKEFNMQNSYSSDEMREDYKVYKKSITGKSFKQKSTPYDAMQIKHINSIKNNIIKKISKEKMNFYSI